MDKTWLNDRRIPALRPLPAPARRAVHRGPGAGARCVPAGPSTRWCGNGLVRRVLREVYAVAQAPDDTRMRAGALGPGDPTRGRRRGPDGCVAARRRHPAAVGAHDRSAPQRGAHDRHPDASPRQTDGRRRGLLPTDVTVVLGVPVTTQLRTALDLGRLLWRFDALAAIDGFLRSGVPHDLLIAGIARFRGYRGVRQLRALAPLGDGRSESAGESALRLHWHDAGLPWPQLQVWIYADDGTPLFRLDIADAGCSLRGGVRRRGVPLRRRGPGARPLTSHLDRRQPVLDDRPVHQGRRLSSGRVSRRSAQSGHREARRKTALWTPRRTER